MSISDTKDKPDSSPCIGRCTLCYGGDFCKGCGRTVAEVRDWNSLSPEFKLIIKERAKQRLDNEEC